MSSFTERINERRDYLLKKGNLNHVSYGIFRLWGALQPVTVRLPVTTIAKMKHLQKRCPAWDSRQEMLFEMVEACVQDWITKQPSPEQAATEFDREARKALQRHPSFRGDPAKDTPEEI